MNQLQMPQAHGIVKLFHNLIQSFLGVNGIAGGKRVGRVEANANAALLLNSVPNRPQLLKLKAKKKIDFCLVIESEGTANTFVANGFCKRHQTILIGAQGVPSNAVRGWVKLIQDELRIPIYFFGDLDAYTMQNIFRTLKAGSAASLIRNSDFSAPDVRFLGVLPEDIKKYELHDYAVKEHDIQEARSLKKAADALKNDPFFKDKRNRGLAKILEWLLKNKRRCEQQAYFMVDPRDPTMPEKIIVDKIKKEHFV